MAILRDSLFFGDTPSPLAILLKRWITRPLLVYLFYRTFIQPMLKRLWTKYYFGRWTHPSVWLNCAASNRSKFLKNVPTAQSYQPTPWIMGSVLQTISGEIPQHLRLGSPSNTVYTERTTIKIPARKKPKGATCCPDFIPKGTVSVDWAEGSPPSSQAEATFLVVPGT